MFVYHKQACIVSTADGPVEVHAPIEVTQNFLILAIAGCKQALLTLEDLTDVVSFMFDFDDPAGAPQIAREIMREANESGDK